MGRRVERLVREWDPALNEGAGGCEETPVEHRLYVYYDWLPIVELDALSGLSIVQKHTWGLDLAGQSGSVGVSPALAGVGVSSASSGQDGAASLTAAGGIGGLLATFDAGSPGHGPLP